MGWAEPINFCVKWLFVHHVIRLIIHFSEKYKVSKPKVSATAESFGLVLLMYSYENFSGFQFSSTNLRFITWCSSLFCKLPEEKLPADSWRSELPDDVIFFSQRLFLAKIFGFNSPRSAKILLGLRISKNHEFFPKLRLGEATLVYWWLSYSFSSNLSDEPYFGLNRPAKREIIEIWKNPTFLSIWDL